MNKKRILIVEDERPLSVAASKSLDRAGFECFIATSSEEALSHLTSYWPVDAVWLDHYLLKHETGLQFLEKFRKVKGCKNTPVFVVTNSVSDEKVDKYAKLGAVHYYIKSNVKLSKIIADIKRILLDD